MILIFIGLNILFMLNTCYLAVYYKANSENSFHMVLYTNSYITEPLESVIEMVTIYSDGIIFESFISANAQKSIGIRLYIIASIQ